jgi:hypothetical protein
MATALSTGLRDYLVMNGSIKKFLNGSILRIYSGTQPATPDVDDTISGTLLNTITLASGTHTPEVLSAGSLTLAGTVGTVTGIVVNSVQILGVTCTFVDSLANLAIAVAAQINTYNSAPEYTAVAVGAKVTVYAAPGTGTGPNGFALATTGAGGITSTDVNMGTEVAGVAMVNGLTYGLSASGVLSKTGTWSGVAAATGTPGWFRIVRSAADASGASVLIRRLDGSISTSSADLNINPNTSTITVTLTIDTFTITQPGS